MTGAAGGTVVLARTPVQLRRARAEVVADATSTGRGRYRAAPEGGDAAGRRDPRPGGTFNAALRPGDPRGSSRGLVRTVEQRAAGSSNGPGAARRAGAAPLSRHREPPADRVRPRLSRPVAPSGPATSSAQPRPGPRRCPGSERDVIPVNPLVVATEPLPASFRAEAGLGRGENFSVHRHLIVYGQRTADDRLVFGGRGAPNHHDARSSRPSTGSRRCSPGSPCRRRPVPRGSRARLHPRLGRRRSGSPATGTRASASPAHRRRVGGRLRRRRRGHHEPRRPHPRGPAHRPHDGADRAGLGRPPFAPLGASRCAGSRSTPGCGRCRSPTARSV